jgi:peptidoglycan/xylan/chitin deacetylase (PgdA/CDA1 family)
MQASSPSTTASPGQLVISLDFELLWGVRHHLDRESYGRNILGVREAIPAMLELFAKHGIHATWATVGFLLCESKDELLARAPAKRPSYQDPSYSNYSYLAEVGPNEKSDPYYFGASLARQILACPGQELGTHTFSHFTCLEPGPTIDDFRADLTAAIDLMRDWSRTCRSIVFPKNQYSEAHLDVCKEAGLFAFRGNEEAWCYRTGARDEQRSKLRRLTRLADAYVDLTGSNAVEYSHTRQGLLNVQSSRFLRPYSRRLRMLEPLRLRRILTAMGQAAKEGKSFHLWWHPHNFGSNVTENIAFLEKLLVHFTQLRDSHGMRSVSMEEAARSSQRSDETLKAA